MAEAPNWKLEDDHKTVTLTFPATSTSPVIVFSLNAAEIENMLENLGHFRALMQPPRQPQKFSLGQKVEAIFNPAWATEPDALNGDSLLHLRDPRFGWSHYLIPREEARKLAATLQTQVNSQPPAPPEGKLN